jgi:hypothetical protein
MQQPLPLLLRRQPWRRLLLLLLLLGVTLGLCLLDCSTDCLIAEVLTPNCCCCC